MKARKDRDPETPEQKRARKRQEAMTRAEQEKAWLENNMGGSGRLQGRPTLFVRPAWEMEDHDRERFYRVHGIVKMFEQIREKVHPADRELVFNALSGTVAFHQLTRLIDDVEFEGEFDDLRRDMEHIRVGFELTLQALDRALRDRGVVLAGFSKGGKSKATPEWHADCIRAARTLLEAGTAPHELAGKLAPRLQRDGKTISGCLEKSGH